MTSDASRIARNTLNYSAVRAMLQPEKYLPPESVRAGNRRFFVEELMRSVGVSTLIEVAEGRDPPAEFIGRLASTCHWPMPDAMDLDVRPANGLDVPAAWYVDHFAGHMTGQFRASVRCCEPNVFAIARAAVAAARLSKLLQENFCRPLRGFGKGVNQPDIYNCGPAPTAKRTEAAWVAYHAAVVAAKYHQPASRLASAGIVAEAIKGFLPRNAHAFPVLLTEADVSPIVRLLAA